MQNFSRQCLNYIVLNFDIRKMNPYEHITVKLSGTKQNVTLVKIKFDSVSKMCKNMPH